MESIEFVKALRQRVIENDFKLYKSLLEFTDQARDPLWNEIIMVYKIMNTEHREVFLQFLRMIQVNTMSHVLGILDGSTYLKEKSENFLLSSEEDSKPLNGDLQNIFLEMEEL